MCNCLSTWPLILVYRSFHDKKMTQFVLLCEQIWHNSMACIELYSFHCHDKIVWFGMRCPVIFYYIVRVLRTIKGRGCSSISLNNKDFSVNLSLLHKHFSFSITSHFLFHSTVWVAMNPCMKFIISILQPSSNLNCSVINRGFTQKSSSWVPNSSQ